MTLKNGHQFGYSKPPPGHENCCWHDPREKHRPAAAAGDFGCVLCGAWTTYCMSAEQADEKMGPCPNRKEEK